jgi:hypothetical protein
MTTSYSRRQVLSLSVCGVVGALAASASHAAQTKTRVDVYKDPSCGCCGKWVEYMNASGFDARVVAGDPTKMKAKLGVGAALQSCHTAVVGGYVLEGHVPASDVRTLLAQKPAGVIGLTIPGMPASAPGMDMKPFQPYTVLSFDKAGRTKPFAKHDKA